jgi:alanyl-tRNA synthetase
VFNLPPERLVVSVFEDDDEAFAIWRDKIGSINILFWDYPKIGLL